MSGLDKIYIGDVIAMIKFVMSVMSDWYKIYMSVSSDWCKIYMSVTSDLQKWTWWHQKNQKNYGFNPPLTHSPTPL